MRGGSERDEELTPIRACTLVRHAHDPARMVSQRSLDLVLEHLTVDGGAVLGAARGGRAALDHEVWYQTVEGRSVICTRCA